MPSATDFLPARMTEFMNFETTTFPYFGSGLISRFSALWRRDIGSSFALLSLAQRKTTQSLGSFCSVLGAPLLAVFHALGVEYAAQNVVAHARQVLHAAAADHHHRMLLQIVSFAGNVADHLKAVGKPDLRHLAQRRIRLLWGRGVDARANAAFLRALLERRHLLLCMLHHARIADELIDRRHRLFCLALPCLALPCLAFTATRPAANETSNSNAQSGRAPFALMRPALTR